MRLFHAALMWVYPVMKVPLGGGIRALCVACLDQGTSGMVVAPGRRRPRGQGRPSVSLSLLLLSKRRLGRLMTLTIVVSSGRAGPRRFSGGEKPTLELAAASRREGAKSTRSSEFGSTFLAVKRNR
ncbi:hypothetical protein F4802DRAFT_20212 [Xylaria palmicola]|nr:hypothetical protein F4802DRAFT_20212 [Xylaria palmicola]